ncbi:MAG: ABC transporter ATP-binding protein [Acidimicrobiales bacterium]
MTTSRKSSSGPAIQVRDLVKVYEPSPLWLRFLLRSAVTSPVIALAGVSLAVGRGEVCAIVGPNGAGKSTLFRVLTGLTTPTSGSASVCGIDVTIDSRAVRELIGFVPAGDQTLYLRLSCIENLLFHGRLQGLGRHDLDRQVKESLDQVGLGGVGSRVGFALSAGMRARLQLARALLNRPQVLILDEPTAAVDPVASYELLQVIERVAAERGVSVLISSHRLEEIEALHDRVVLFDGGRIVYSGDLESLRRLYHRPVIELGFETTEQLEGALDVFSSVAGLDVLAVAGCRVSLSTGMAIGALLQRLDGQLGGLAFVSETQMPLRDLLHDILDPTRAPASAGPVPAGESA